MTAAAQALRHLGALAARRAGRRVVVTLAPGVEISLVAPGKALLPPGDPLPWSVEPPLADAAGHLTRAGFTLERLDDDGAVLTDARGQALHLTLRDPATVFTALMADGGWSGPWESRSGAGSGLEGTAALRATLPDLLRDLEADTLVDVPCGDFFWMSHVDLPVRRYIGGDVVPELIAENRRRHGSPTRTFEVVDLTRGPLPDGDVILVRDCLQHLSDAWIADALRVLHASSATWILLTTWPSLEANRPGRTGGFRRLNMTLPPFSLPPPRRLLPDPDTAQLAHFRATGQVPRGSAEEIAAWEARFHDKSLGLWRREDLRPRSP